MNGYKEVKGQYTPWGEAQYVCNIRRGVRWYVTAGHGGLAVSPGVAEKELSPAAVKLGESYGNYVWYEEDVAWAIPFYERPEWEEAAVKKMGGEVRTQEEKEKIIREYFPEYFELRKTLTQHLPRPRKGLVVKFVKDAVFTAPSDQEFHIPKGTTAPIDKVTARYVYLRLPGIIPGYAYLGFDRADYGDKFRP